MKLQADLRITASLQVTDAEAEVLYLLTSYDLAEWFAAKCNRREKSPEQIKAVLSSIHQQTHKLLTVRKEAMAALGVEVQLP